MAYALDLTASLPANLVTSEHDRGDLLVWFFRPKGGAFYTKDLKLSNPVTGTILQPNIQYRVLNANIDAEMESGKEVGTSILILDSSVTALTLQRRVVGGRYEPVGSDIDEIITDQDINDLNATSWNQVIGQPKQFPPDPSHRHYTGDVYGWEHVTYILSSIHEIVNGGARNNGFGMGFQYINQRFDELTKVTDQRLDAIESLIAGMSGNTQFGIGHIVLSTTGRNPALDLRYGIWRRLSNTLLYSVLNDADLGQLRKVGEGTTHLMTGVAAWELIGF